MGLYYDICLVLLAHTDEIFLETPFSARLWLESVYFDKMLLEGSHEIIHVFTDEYLEYEIASLFEKYFRYIEDRKVEFY